MSAPVLLFVATEMRATALQRAHDSDVVQVRPIMRHIADRASAIIVERVPHDMSIDQASRKDWVEWLPTRLEPGSLGRITFL